MPTAQRNDAYGIIAHQENMSVKCIPLNRKTGVCRALPNFLIQNIHNDCGYPLEPVCCEQKYLKNQKIFQ